MDEELLVCVGVTDCDYCGEIVTCYEDAGGKGCKRCLRDQEVQIEVEKPKIGDRFPNNNYF